MEIKKNKSRKKRSEGQATVETLVILVLIIGLISGFFVYIYQASVVIWAKYHLNQAIHCEESKVLQTQKYIDSRIKTSKHMAALPIEHGRSRPHRRNKNCLAKAKANIQKLTPWQKAEVRRNDVTKEYEVIFKWDKSRKILITAKRN
jgi:hypothetical protein